MTGAVLVLALKVLPSRELPIPGKPGWLITLYWPVNSPISIQGTALSLGPQVSKSSWLSVSHIQTTQEFLSVSCLHMVFSLPSPFKSQLHDLLCVYTLVSDFPWLNPIHCSPFHSPSEICPPSLNFRGSLFFISRDCDQMILVRMVAIVCVQALFPVLL